MVLSNPVLAPKSLRLFATVELEFNWDDIVETLVHGGCPETAAEVAEGDAWERGSGFGILIGLRVRMRQDEMGMGDIANAYQFFVGRSDGVVVFA